LLGFALGYVAAHVTTLLELHAELIKPLGAKVE
jgi:hypothetical protein